jgi:hypothetical protein
MLGVLLEDQLNSKQSCKTALPRNLLFRLTIIILFFGCYCLKLQTNTPCYYCFSTLTFRKQILTVLKSNGPAFINIFGNSS